MASVIERASSRGKIRMMNKSHHLKFSDYVKPSLLSRTRTRLASERALAEAEGILFTLGLWFL